MIQKFKKKPVEIEAIQYNNLNRMEIEKFVGKKLPQELETETAYLAGKGSPKFSILIETKESSMKAIVGDWIIKGVKGEFYPCKNDIFKMTYDVVIPKDIVNAQKYLQECGDMGFMGSPNEYDRQKKIVDAYFEPIRQKEKEDAEKAEYLKLKSKYGGS